MNVAIISIVEAIYLVYMFIFFKTRIGFHHPLEGLVTGRSAFTAHPMYQTSVPVCRICKFGQYASIVGAFYLLLRILLHRIKSVDRQQLCRVNRILLWTAFVIALVMNMNAALYLLPIVITESLITVEFLCQKQC
jgi:hypothetical protein